MEWNGRRKNNNNQRNVNAINNNANRTAWKPSTTFNVNNARQQIQRQPTNPITSIKPTNNQRMEWNGMEGMEMEWKNG